MNNLTATRVRYGKPDNLPLLMIDFDNPQIPRLVVNEEDGLRWMGGRGGVAVAVQGEGEELLTWTHPDGRVFRAVTDDPQILAIAKQFYLDMTKHPEKFEEDKLIDQPIAPVV